MSSAKDIADVLINPSDKEEHVALLYDTDEEKNAYVAAFLNEGLKKGELCVYATVHFREQGHMEKVSSLITNYKDNVDRENLLIVDLAPHYISALLRDINLFEESKKLILEKVNSRTEKQVRFIGDCVGFLFKNKHFDECAMVEQWWHEKPLEGSIICLYPRQFFKAYPYEDFSKHAVVSTHDLVLDKATDGQHQSALAISKDDVSMYNIKKTCEGVQDK